MQRIVALFLLFGCLASSSCKRPANPSLGTAGNSPSVRDSDGQSNQGIVAQSPVVESQRDAIPSEVEIEELLRRGELKKATKAAQARLMVNPNEPQSIFLLARSMAAQNRFSEAIRLLADIPENESDAKLAATPPIVGFVSTLM